MNIAIIILWLNAQGSIAAVAAGAAPTPARCEQMAAERIQQEAGNEKLAGTTPHVMCLELKPQEKPSAPEKKPGDIET